MNTSITTKNKLNKIIPYMAIVLLAFVTSLVLVSNPFSEWFPKHDSSMFTYFGYAMNQGKTLYSEIFDHKGPVIFIINYFGVLFSAHSFAGIYLFELLSIFLFFVFTYWLGRLWLPNYSALIPLVIEAIVLALFIEGGNLTEEYALPFIAYSLYVFSKYYKSEGKIVGHEIILSGVSFAIVFLLRANMISVWAAFCFIVLVEFLINKKYKELFKVLGLFLLGTLLILVPIGIYLYSNGALEAGVFQAFLFSFMYLDSSKEKGEAIRLLYHIQSTHYVTAFFMAYLILVIYKWKNYTANEKLLSLSIILFTLLSFFTSVMSGRAYKHYLMAMIPTMSMPLIFNLNELRKNNSSIKLLFSFLLLIFVLYNNQLKIFSDMVYITNTNVREINFAKKLDANDKAVLENAEKNRKELAVANVIKENSSKDEYIYVHRNGGSLYLLSDRLSSIKYFNLPSVNLNDTQMIGEDFLNDIINANTEVIVLSKAFNNSDKTSTDLMFFDYVAENYNPIEEINDFIIYKKK